MSLTFNRSQGRPKRKKSKPLARRHFAYLTSPRNSTYSCPTCGPLGGLSEAVAHAIANQYDVVPEP